MDIYCHHFYLECQQVNESYVQPKYIEIKGNLSEQNMAAAMAKLLHAQFLTQKRQTASIVSGPLKSMHLFRISAYMNFFDYIAWMDVG